MCDEKEVILKGYGTKVYNSKGISQYREFQ